MKVTRNTYASAYQKYKLQDWHRKIHIGRIQQAEIASMANSDEKIDDESTANIVELDFSGNISYNSSSNPQAPEGQKRNRLKIREYQKFCQAVQTNTKSMTKE